MTTRKKKAEGEQPAAGVPLFSKQKLLTFQRYAGRRDLLSALLEDGRQYTIDQVDSLIEHFMKGKVK